MEAFIAFLSYKNFRIELPWICRACGEEFDTRELAFEHLLRKHHGQKWKGMVKQVKETKGEVPLDQFLP